MHMQEETLVEPEVVAVYKRSITQYIFHSIGLFIVVLLALILTLVRLNAPSPDFPVDQIIEIPEGLSVAEIASDLDTQNVVRSALYLQVILKYSFDDTFVQAGQYIFENPKSTKEVAERLTSGADNQPHTVLTIPEGLDGEGMYPIIIDELPHLENELNPSTLDEHIGFLFPDTYFVNTTATTGELITLMRDTYTEKTTHLTSEIESSILTEEGIITLASIVEREANTEESMRTVAGILWSRIALGMALQVDATFEFLLGKTSAELTIEDLKMDSPYNTYTNRGLPPTPIANPGLTAIEAVLNPIETEYLYYLTGNDGEFYYAETFDGHKRNKERYLR